MTDKSQKRATPEQLADLQEKMKAAPQSAQLHAVILLAAMNSDTLPTEVRADIIDSGLKAFADQVTGELMHVVVDAIARGEDPEAVLTSLTIRFLKVGVGAQQRAERFFNLLQLVTDAVKKKNEARDANPAV